MGNSAVTHANTLYTYGRYEEVIKVLDGHLEKNTDDPIALNNKANALVMLGRYQESIPYFEKSYQLDQSVPNPLVGKSLALMHLERYKEALALFECALKIDHSIKYPFEGVLHYKLGNLDEAISSYDKYLHFDKTNAITHLNKGIALEKKSLLGEALNCYDEAIRHDKHLTSAYLRKGALLFTMCKYEEAMLLFDLALRIDPNSTEAAFNKAEALIKLGRHEEAIECCDQRGQPPGKALYYSKTPKVKSSVDSKCSIICDTLKHLPPIMLAKAKAFSALGNKESKMKCCEEVLKLKTEDAWDHYYVGQALMESGMRVMAYACLEQVLKVDPKFSKKRDVEVLLQGLKEELDK